MKILHINTNELRGGAARVMMRLVKTQLELGHNCKVLVGKKESSSHVTFPFDTLQNGNIEQECVKEGYLDYSNLGAFLLPENPIVKEADVIHLHNLHGNYFHPYALSSLSHVKPVVWTLHDMQSITGHCSYSHDCDQWISGCGECRYLEEYPKLHVDRTELNLLEKLDVYNHSKLNVVAVASWLGKMARKGILSNHPIEVILNGVDVSTYHPKNKKKMKEKYGIPTDQLIIGAVANGGAFGQDRKGGHYVQAIINRLIEEKHNILLVNVGSEKQGFESDYIYNVGYISSEEEMSEVYNTFDIFLFPSVADTCPLVISEAMACGVPIVTFETGGIPEIVKHGKTGFVAPLKNLEELYKYTETLIKDRDLLKAFSNEALEYSVSNFEHRDVAEKYISVYEKAITRFKEKEEETLYFNLEKVPEIVKKQKEFQLAEINKGQINSIKKIDPPNQEVTILNINDDSFSDGDIFYIVRNNFRINGSYIATMLYKNLKTDILVSKVLLTRNNGESFYNPISVCNSESLIVDTSFGGIFYSSSFFQNNKNEIIKGNSVSYSSKEEFATESISLSIDDFMKLKIKEPNIYIYGAGTHTKELLNESNYLKKRTIAIVDGNPNKIGGVFSTFEVISINEIDSRIPILISSASFEEEIYKELSAKTPNKIIRIYNG